MAEIVSGGGRRRAPERPPESERPLSELTDQGWEVQHYAVAVGTSGMLEHFFYLRRQRENRVLLVRRKVMGEGMHGEAFDV